LGQLVVKAALVAEAPDERVDQSRAESERKLQTLDGDRFAQPDVHPLVHDAEAPLADVAIDAEMSVEHLADEAERVRSGRHGD
jgi:hypothetical protein